MFYQGVNNFNLLCNMPGSANFYKGVHPHGDFVNPLIFLYY